MEILKSLIKIKVLFQKVYPCVSEFINILQFYSCILYTPHTRTLRGSKCSRRRVDSCLVYISGVSFAKLWCKWRNNMLVLGYFYIFYFHAFFILKRISRHHDPQCTFFLMKYILFIIKEKEAAAHKFDFIFTERSKFSRRCSNSHW